MGDNQNIPARTVVLLLIGDISMDGRVQKEIRTLKSHGFQVTLIQWPYRGRFGSHGDVEIEVIDYPYRLHRNAAINFLRQIQFNFFAFRHLKRLAPDFLQCNDLNTLLAGFLFRGRAHLIYDAHELATETHKGVRKWVWSALERWMVPSCDAFILPEKNRLAYFAAKYQINPTRIVLVENFPSRRYVFSRRNWLREYFDLAPERVILLCTGVLGPGRGIEEMIGSMAFLDSRCVLVLLGPTFREYQKAITGRINERNLGDRVKLHPAIRNVEMLDYIRCSDIGLIFYQNTNLNNYWCASNRLYEFILCGKAVVTNDYPGLREVVEKNHLGVCLSETSPQTIANAVRRLLDTFSQPTKASPFVWEHQEATYLKVYE